jgi:hypothetical protein
MRTPSWLASIGSEAGVEMFKMLIGAFICSNITAVQDSLVTKRSLFGTKLGLMDYPIADLDPSVVKFVSGRQLLYA